MKKLIVVLLCAVALLLGSQGAWAVERIDVNSASIERLQALPGIGEALLAQLREQVTAAPRGSAK